MDEATASKQPAKKSVAPFSAEHGVNPGWGVYEERPAIPAFTGVAEISKLPLQKKKRKIVLRCLSQKLLLLRCYAC